MTAKILDGNAVAKQVRAEWKARVDALKARGITPALAVIRVGSNPASKVYVDNKLRACAEAGVHSELHVPDARCTEGDVLSLIERLNRAPGIHGILLQLPLPPHLDAATIGETIDPRKDVDGFTWHHLGALLAGQPRFEPCTPSGVIQLLDSAGIAIDGREAVVVGRSAIVGKPMALMLLRRGATVTVCHSRTPDLGAHTRRADILVVAVGRPRLVTADMVKPGAAVIDVGINRLDAGGLVGDVDYGSVREVAGWITPVPGGVGPMTVAMLIRNTVMAAEGLAAGQLQRRAGA
jgi:methylenetetrahydrofolate dehydrogenase (NADP+)/methenyltetrahydrofolate cyclohydrolase